MLTDRRSRQAGELHRRKRGAKGPGIRASAIPMKQGTDAASIHCIVRVGPRARPILSPSRLPAISPDSAARQGQAVGLGGQPPGSLAREAPPRSRSLVEQVPEARGPGERLQQGHATQEAEALAQFRPPAPPIGPHGPELSGQTRHKTHGHS